MNDSAANVVYKYVMVLVNKDDEDEIIGSPLGNETKSNFIWSAACFVIDVNYKLVHVVMPC